MNKEFESLENKSKLAFYIYAPKNMNEIVELCKSFSCAIPKKIKLV